MNHLRAAALVVVCALLADCGSSENQSTRTPATRTRIIGTTSPSPDPATPAPNLPRPTPTSARSSPTGNAVPPTTIPAPTVVRAQVPNRPGAVPVTSTELLEGGKSYRYGLFTFLMPEGITLKWGESLNDPGGYSLFVIYDPDGRGGLRLWPSTGKESGRHATDSSMNAVFDALVTSIIVDAAPNRPEALLMESVTTLTGGIAYRYERTTFVIPGGWEFTWTALPPDPDGRHFFVLVEDSLASGVTLTIDAATGMEGARQMTGDPQLLPMLSTILDGIIASIIIDRY